MPLHKVYSGCIIVDYGVLLAGFFGLLLIIVLIRLFYTPLRWTVVILYHGIAGGLILWLFNLLGSHVGLHVALNPVSALITGFLGLPGMAVLLVAGYLVP